MADKEIRDEDSFGTRVKKDPTILLDITNDIEQIPIGPNEIERNQSRLNKLVTGEKRPASHTAKEAVAWTASNVAVPVLLSAIKGASIASKGKKGLKAINAIDNAGDVKNAAKSAESLARKAFEEASKKSAEKAGQNKSRSVLGSILKSSLQMGTEQLDERVAKNRVNNIGIAIKAMNKYAPGLPMDMINRYGREEGAKLLIGLLAGVKGGKLISKGLPNDKDFEKEEARGLDPRIEMNGLQKAVQFGKSLFDLDDLDPSTYPMDMIDKLIVQTNADTDKWNKDQIDSLSDAEKIKLVKDTMKGKYNDQEDISKVMLENYLRLTNTDGE